MLRHLQIRDFAIIDAVELEFSAGLTVLTGETGAGKSIIVDALELLCRRPRRRRRRARRCRARRHRRDGRHLAAPAASCAHLLEEQSIASEGELVLRRVVGSDGRSRAWLNGQTVPLQVLRSVAELLFDIHGQHEFQSLVRPAPRSARWSTAFGRLESLAGQVRAAHSVWLTLLNRSLELESAADERSSRLDLLRHQLQEIEALQLKAGEIARAARRSTRVWPIAAG